MRSPGLLSKHYAPRAPLTLYEGDPATAAARLAADAARLRATGRRVGVLDCSTRAPARVAATLYDALRAFDADKVEQILACGCATTDGLGRAIQDRLRRAAAGRIVRA
jgi:L-threonylcarbamoyladenylate synthase